MRSMYDIRSHNENPLGYWQDQHTLARNTGNLEMQELSERMIERHGGTVDREARRLRLLKELAALDG